MAEASIDDILAQAENPAYVRIVTARVLLRQDLVRRHGQLDTELARAVEEDARHNRSALAPQIAEELKALEDEIDQAKVEFRFKSIGKRAWADLLAKHPPTKEQRRADPRIDHNPVTFPVAAIALSCVDPELTEDDVHRLERAFNSSQFDLLWAKCIDANIGGLIDPKSLAAGAIRRVSSPSESSVTAMDELSLAASSLVG